MMCHGKKINIKKQIFFALGLFFSVSSLNAMCPETVGAVTPGEGIWRIASRIGEAMNVIQSQICSLDIVVSSTVNNDCTFEFGQDDIGAGGIYTIGVPGTYCMKENVSFSTGVAITVTSNDVTIDMHGHTLDGGNNSTVGIELGNGVQNIIIKNGFIENIGGNTFGNGVGIRDEIDALDPLKNIVIQDVHFAHIGSPLPLVQQNGAIQFVFADSLVAQEEPNSSIIIENCTTFNAGSITVASDSVIVRGCNVQEGRDLLGTQAGIRCGKLYFTSTNFPNSTNVLIEDCISTSSYSANAANLVIRGSENAIIKNCMVQGADKPGAVTGIAFNIDTCKNMLISDCIGQFDGLGSFGFNISNALLDGSLVVERCIANGFGGGEGFSIIITSASIAFVPTVKFVDCVAENNGYGFSLRIDKAITWSDIIFQGCLAQSNSLSGFLVRLTIGAGDSSNIIFQDCVSQNNSGDGFSLLNQSSSSIISSAVFRNCVAQNNQGGVDASFGITYVGDGFGIGSSPQNVGIISDVVCQNCIAEDNVHNGFSFGATVTGSKILDCCAMNNTVTGIDNLPGEINAVLGNAAFNNAGGDISGVVDPSLLITRSIAGRLAGALRWVNAIS